MDRTSHVLWAKHLIKAAIEYFNERSTRACLLIDNLVLKDGVLASMSEHDRTEFIVCVAPGFTTMMDLGDTDICVTVRFRSCTHFMCIPYNAISAVLAANANGVLTDEGQVNVINIPPVVYPPGSKYRTEHALDAVAQPVEIEMIVPQPEQVELRSVIRRRRSD